MFLETQFVKKLLSSRVFAFENCPSDSVLTPPVPPHGVPSARRDWIYHSAIHVLFRPCLFHFYVPLESSFESLSKCCVCQKSGISMEIIKIAELGTWLDIEQISTNNFKLKILWFRTPLTKTLYLPSYRVEWYVNQTNDKKSAWGS